MRKIIFVKAHVFFALFFCFLQLIFPCVSDRNVNNEANHLHHKKSHHHEDDTILSRSSPKGPRLVGLDVNGRVTSLLWNNPKTSMDSTLTPLFSSPYEHEDDEDEGRVSHSNDPRAKTARTSDKSREGGKQQRPESMFLPSAVYGRADYRFRKERWYGVEKIGMIFRWNRPRTWSHSDARGDQDEIHALSRQKISHCWLPTIFDIAAYRSVFARPKIVRNEGFPSFVDSANLRIGWGEIFDNDEINVGDINPWIQIGFEPKFSSSDDLLAMHSSERKKKPLHLGFFFPLIRRRLNLQWTSRWGNSPTTRTGERGSDASNQWSSKRRLYDDDPWWIPQVSLDPSMGTLSSENRYRNAIFGKDSGRYLTEVKLRVRTTIPTLLSSITNNFIEPSEDDDDLQAASLRLEYSLMKSPGDQTRPALGSALTTARFETIIIPSFWMRSVTETAKFGLIHEQNHVTINQ